MIPKETSKSNGHGYFGFHILPPTLPPPLAHSYSNVHNREATPPAHTWEMWKFILNDTQPCYRYQPPREPRREVFIAVGTLPVQVPNDRSNLTWRGLHAYSLPRPARYTTPTSSSTCCKHKRTFQQRTDSHVVYSRKSPPPNRSQWAPTNNIRHTAAE